jgi:hypothetical protein
MWLRMGSTPLPLGSTGSSTPTRGRLKPALRAGTYEPAGRLEGSGRGFLPPFDDFVVDLGSVVG